MDILGVLKTYNQECSHAERIKESVYVETPMEDPKKSHLKKTHMEKKIRMRSVSLVQCIVSQYDPLYQTIPISERRMYLKQRIMEIGSQIEEKPHEFYDNFQFDPKTMKPKLIQLSLQMSLEGKNTRAGLVYLNELYKRNFTLVEGNLYYPTCPKAYPVETIVCDNKSYRIQEIDLSSYEKGHLDNIPLLNDLGKKDIYPCPLMPISKYRSEELKIMCGTEGISLKTDTGKMKVKKVLYNELVIHLM